MRELSDELDDLSKLDELRNKARKLKNEGMDALGKIINNSAPSWNGRITDHPGAPNHHRTTRHDDVQVEGPSTTPKWHGSGGKIEAAMLARVQCKHHPERNGQKGPLIQQLTSISLIEDLLQLVPEDAADEESGMPSKQEPAGEATSSPSPERRLRSDVDEVPVLLAARAMQALVPSAQHTFSRATMLCYYRIIREICVADSPDWNAGGARAGVGGEVTAYVTAECIRAVLMLERSIRGTADFLRATDKFYRYALFLQSVQGAFLAKWREVEAERAALDWYITMVQQRPYLALSLPLPNLAKSGNGKSDQRLMLKEMLAFLKDLGKSIQDGLEASVKAFNLAVEEIQKARALEERRAISPQTRDDDVDGSKSAAKDSAVHGVATVKLGETSERLDSRFVRSMSAHAVAEGVIQKALTDAHVMVTDCKCPGGPLENLHRLASRFEAIAHQVRTLLDPAKQYIASVLDHELTAASQEKPVWDARELAFAAGAYGALTKWRTDERLNRAATLLSNDISPSGLFRLGRPFHTVPSGLRWQPLHFEVCRAFSELMANVDVAVNPNLIGQLLSPFEKMSIELKFDENPQIPRMLLSPDHGRQEGKLRGWHMEDPPIPMRPTLWVSGHATLALDKLVRMLDQKINNIILDYFTYKKPDAIEFKLEDLFYPDYGREVFFRHDKNGPASDDKAANESIGITLQRMRAHIVDAKLSGAYADPVFSNVLHGPPGTGKTTLLEALAKSSGAPLVEMSPSDIAMKGEQAIEARARATFQALAMLTQVVIIFDEFEPVLQERGSQEDSTELRSMYTFLTPGMLPKLTRLHDEARHKRTGYTLVTNHLRKLDKAAIRPGRFDRHTGIYMPDPVSRAGYFMKILAMSMEKANCELSEPKPAKKLFVLTADQRERFDLIVRKSGGIPPSRLVPRWFKVLNGVDGAYGGGDFVLSGHPWTFLDEHKLPSPGDKEYAQLFLSEEHRLNAWEWIVQSAPATRGLLNELLVRPGTQIDHKDEEFRNEAKSLAEVAELRRIAQIRQAEEAQRKAEQQAADHRDA
jgi:hypothetical protein